MKQDQASRTAKFVSNGIYWVSQQPALSIEVLPTLSRYTAAMTMHINSQRFFGSAKLRRAMLLKQCQVLQAGSVPGIYLHQVLRKRCIESLARSAVLGGTQQIVIIGSGFDTLSLRLSVEMPQLTIIELDHPATQIVKTAAIKRFQIATGECHFFPVDLSVQTLSSALAGCPKYAPKRSTLFIVEGLTMYLSEERVREMLQCIAAQAFGSKFIFTYMEELEHQNFSFQNERFATSLWLAFQHERFTWGIKSSKLPAFLAKSGFQLLEHKTHQDLRLELLTKKNRQATLAIGENIALVVHPDLGN